MSGKIIAVCTSLDKGTQKSNVGSAKVVANHGIEGDAHAGPWHRQVSMLAEESIDKMRQKGLNLSYGDFGENIVTQGIDLPALPVGTRLRLGDSVLGEVTQIGKECHTRCAIYYQAGDCIMPREGIFIEILLGGRISAGDTIQIINETSKSVPSPQ